MGRYYNAVKGIKPKVSPYDYLPTEYREAMRARDKRVEANRKEDERLATVEAELQRAGERKAELNRKRQARWYAKHEAVKQRILRGTYKK